MGKSYYVLMDDRVSVREVDGLSWAQWFLGAGDHRLVAVGFVAGATISTQFIGVSFQVQGPPLLWQTIIIGGDRNGYQRSYASLEAARVGHQELIEQLKSAQAHRRANGKAGSR
jgi:hypothetical protein